MEYSAAGTYKYQHLRRAEALVFVCGGCTGAGNQGDDEDDEDTGRSQGSMPVDGGVEEGRGVRGMVMW